MMLMGVGWIENFAAQNVLADLGRLAVDLRKTA